MSEHPWDTYRREHKQPTERLDAEPKDTYRCETCTEKAYMPGSQMATHLETIHGIRLPMTPSQIGARFLDGPNFHAIETIWEYGKVRVVQRRRTG